MKWNISSWDWQSEKKCLKHNHVTALFLHDDDKITFMKQLFLFFDKRNVFNVSKDGWFSEMSPGTADFSVLNLTTVFSRP